jgi:hypothetical protein
MQNELEKEQAAQALKIKEYEAEAKRIQEQVGRTDREDECVVQYYIRAQLEKVCPGALVYIQPPEDSSAIKAFLGVDTQDRAFEIFLPDSTRREAIRLFEAEDDDNSASLNPIVERLHQALPEKLPLTPNSFIHLDARLNYPRMRDDKGTIRDDTSKEQVLTIRGFLSGSSAKLAAEIRGELNLDLSGHGKDGKSPVQVTGINGQGHQKK